MKISNVTYNDRQLITQVYKKLRPPRPTHVEACKRIAEAYGVHWMTIQKIVKEGRDDG